MNIAVLGAGAWGTALAIHFARQHPVQLWTHNSAHAAQLTQSHQNQRYLPDYPFPPQLTVTAELQAALNQAELIIIATPVAGLRSTLEAIKARHGQDIPILAACKGFETESGLLPHQVMAAVLPDNNRCGLLSGPSFAQELAQQLPCAVCLAGSHTQWLQAVITALNTPVMRLYANQDVIGVAVGGAVKNVMAIATGLSDGLHCGLNARAALMTRGLAEINRLAQALGAEETTLMGLAGMGDLILTCTGNLSRNRQVGLKLAEGKALPDILTELGHVAEGVYTITEAHKMAQRLQIELPITAMLYRLIQGEISAHQVVDALMMRSPKFEHPGQTP